MSRGRTPLFRSLISQLKAARGADEGYSRRQFISTASAALAASTLLGCASQVGQVGRVGQVGQVGQSQQKLNGPVIILGGGIAGLSAAYTLMKKGVACEIYEASNRFGGRIFTKRNFNTEGMFCELGGELVDSNHQALIELCGEMGLELQNLKAGDEGLDFYHANEEIYTDSDVIPAFQSLARRIAADAAGLIDAQGEYTAQAKALDVVSLRAYLTDAGAKTPPWLIKMLDLAYTCELGLETDQQSSLNLINLISPDTDKGFQVFGASDETFRIRGGNEQLPAAVFQQISHQVPTHPNHELVGIKAEGSRIHLTFKNAGGLVTRQASHVICAIPFSVLRKVEGIQTLPISAPKRQIIREMGYGTNLKVMWGVTNPVWRQPTLARRFFCNGSVISDLPFQQVWETSRGQSGNLGIITNFIGGAAGANWTTARNAVFPAELEKVFPALAGQWGEKPSVMNWPQIKWTKGSYGAPRPGQYTWMYTAAAASEMGGALCFAGEHTSAESGGFMNGGVESGIRAANEILGA